MKILRLQLLAVLLIALIAVTGCATFKQINPDNVAPYARAGVALTCRLVLNFAVDGADRVEKAKWIAGIAGGVRTLMTGEMVTPAQVEKVVNLWTPEKPHWTNLVTDIGRVYAAVYPQISGDARLTLEVLGAVAAGAEDASLEYLR
jgi:hypothetical protein